MLQNELEATLAEFEQWWEATGCLCRSGGGDYEKTFAWNAWLEVTSRWKDSLTDKDRSDGASD